MEEYRSTVPFQIRGQNDDSDDDDHSSDNDNDGDDGVLEWGGQARQEDQTRRLQSPCVRRKPHCGTTSSH